MNPYTKKFLDFEQTDENVKFTDIYKMSKFPYELWALEEQMKSLQKWVVKDKLENQEYENSNFQVIQDLYNEKQKRKEYKRPFFFITINPKPDTDFNEFKSAVEDISTWCWVDKCYWVFEQRGTNETDIGNGFHAHILIEKHNIEKGKCKTQIKNKFKKFVGVLNDNTINVQDKKREWLQDKLDYILGEKYDEGKPEKQEIDKIWRKKNNIESYYKFDTLTDKRRVSNSLGGRREGSGVKNGTKRGKYNCKKNNLLTEDCENSIKIVHKKKILEF